VDAVVIAADSIHKELFQVAATRGREHIQIVTADKAALQKSIGISDQRQSVTELVGRRNWAILAARREALSTPAHTLWYELENCHQAQQNPNLIQQTNQGIEYGIRS
jgi:hypothetical protein